MSLAPLRRVILAVLCMGFIAISGCTNTSPSPAVSPSPPATVVAQPQETRNVSIEDFTFSPASIRVPRGTTVTWANRDPGAHRISDDVEGYLFLSPILLKGDNYSFKFDDPGTYPYYCTIHPGMKGKVIVT